MSSIACCSTAAARWCSASIATVAGAGKNSGRGKLMSYSRHLASLSALTAAAAILLSTQSASAESMVERGKYLVTIASCNDCHTPGYFLGKPDMARFLGGSDVGFELPGLGVFVGRNLTPD